MKKILVLDINLFIAAYWNPLSASAGIIRACLEGRFVAAYTDEMLRGLRRILRNIRAGEDYRQEVVEPLVKLGQKFEPKPAPVTSEDPEDQAFLECAIAAEADYLITSDRHLLKLSYVDRTVILTPTRFLAQTHLD